MALFVILISVLCVGGLRTRDSGWVSTPNNVFRPLSAAQNARCTCFLTAIPVQTPKVREKDINVAWNLSADLPRYQSLLVLNNYFVCLFNERSWLDLMHQRSRVLSDYAAKQRWMIVLLLLMSGNVQPNPGPELHTIQMPSDIKQMSGLSIVHLNVRSLLPKMDSLRIWITTTDADVVVISETWLTKSVTDKDIAVEGYNVFRADRLRKGGGVAIYVKLKFHVNVAHSESIPKKLDFLAINVKISNAFCITVVGCYRPPSALNDALQSLTHLLSRLNYSEIVLAGDLNWDWLNPVSDNLKSFCDSVNLTQLINSPTRPNLKCPARSTLIDLILTNAPHKYSAIGVLCNDLSDHCLVVAIRNTKIPKLKSRIICKRHLKYFNEQGFHHDLHEFKWDRIELIPDVETAWTFFRDGFMKIINTHAPFRKFRVKGRDNPWFSTELADTIHERNLAWVKARTTGSMADWLFFRQLRNKCTSFIKKAKSDYYLSVTTENLNNPRKFWKTIKSLSVCNDGQTLPTFIKKDSVAIYDKMEMLNCFNRHFISSGSLFDAVGSVPAKPCSDIPVHIDQPFHFKPFSVSEVHKALKILDPKKPPGPDFLDPYFLKLAADFVAGPLAYLFNLTLENNEIPKIWKSAFVLPVLKGGDSSTLNNYRPISNLSVLAKVLENLVSNSLKEFLYNNAILSTYQSGFRKRHSTITAAIKVVNDITVALDKRQHCASLFIDLSKAFDTVDHDVLKLRLLNSGLSENAVAWFSNYLCDRSQCVKYDGLCSEVVPILKGVPQGSVLGPLLFTIYINNLGQNVSDANFHFYADDTVIYCCAVSLEKAIENLINAFTVVQNNLLQLKLILNADKTKLMLFTSSKVRPLTIPKVVTLEGGEIEIVDSYKYLGILIDDSLTFKPHVQNLVKKLRLKLGFYFRNKLCFSFNVKKQLVAATFLSVLDYGDLLYMHSSTQCLLKLDSVYHASLRFITNCRALTHHCELYSRVGWPSLTTRRLCHWYIFIYKVIIGLLPLYLCELIKHKNTGQYALRSQNLILLDVPNVRTELGKKAFVYAAPTAWNLLQNELKMRLFITLEAFKSKMNEKKTDSLRCRCFLNY